MAPKKKQKKKAAKRGAKAKQASRWLLSAGFFTSVGIITLLAFVSFELAFICLIFLALASYLTHSARQRSLWEKAANFKFTKLKQNHEKLARTVSKNDDNISTLVKAFDTDIAGFAPEGFRPKVRSAPPPRKPRAAQKAQAAKPKAKAATPKEQREKKVAAMIANENTMADHDVFSDMVVRELVHSAIRKKKVDIFVQPIVRLPQRQVRFYEVYGRVRAKAGMYLPAERFIELAREDEVINDLDNLLLIQCIKTIKETAHITKAAPFFINITSSTITNADFMKKLLYFISNNRKLALRLVFEIRQDDFENMSPAVLEILRGLGKIGCSLSIDHVKTFDFDIKFLQSLRVRFVKITTEDLLLKISNTKDMMEMRRLKRKLEGNDIGFIVEKIETEKELVELLDYNIHFGQGYLFGRPALQSAYQGQYKKSA